MDLISFRKDAFLMSFLLRSSFALNLETAEHVPHRLASNSSSQSSSSRESSASGIQEHSSGPIPSDIAVIENYFYDACRTSDSHYDKKIERLSKIKINQEHVDNMELCSICMENFNLDEEAKQLPCKHLFHDLCVSPWLKKRQTCPICRKVAVSVKERKRFRFSPFSRTGLLGHCPHWRRL